LKTSAVVCQFSYPIKAKIYYFSSNCSRKTYCKTSDITQSLNRIVIINKEQRTVPKHCDLFKNKCPQVKEVMFLVRYEVMDNTTEIMS